MGRVEHVARLVDGLLEQQAMRIASKRDAEDDRLHVLDRERRARLGVLCKAPDGVEGAKGQRYQPSAKALRALRRSASKDT